MAEEGRPLPGGAEAARAQVGGSLRVAISSSPWKLLSLALLNVVLRLRACSAGSMKAWVCPQAGPWWCRKQYPEAPEAGAAGGQSDPQSESGSQDEY